MGHPLRLVALTGSLLLLAGCATKVRTDFGRQTDLAGFRTFHVLEQPLSVPDDPTLTTPFSHEDLREEIRHELHRLGFRPASATSADFLVGFHVVYGQRVSSATDPTPPEARGDVQRVGRRGHGGRLGYGGFGRRGFGYGYGGFGHRGYGDLGPRIVGEGTLVIDVIDRRADRLAWRGWSHRRLGARRPDPDRLSEELAKLVPRILDEFPPESTARRAGGRRANAPAAPRRNEPGRRISTDEGLEA